MDELLLDRSDVRDPTLGMRISIVDHEHRLIGSSWNGPFGAQMHLPSGEGSRLETNGDTVAAFAAERPFHGFPGSGFRCLIEQRPPKESDFYASLRDDQRGSLPMSETEVDPSPHDTSIID